MSRLFVAPMVILGAFFVLGAVVWSQRGEDKAKPNSLKGQNVSLSSSAELAPNGDKDGNGQLNGGDTALFKFKIEHRGSETAQFMKLKTGLARDQLYFIRNTVGTTGYDYEDNTLTFKNLVVQNGQVIDISFEAALQYSPDDKELQLKPELYDESGTLLNSGELKKAKVNKGGAQPVPNVKVEGVAP